jgi:hypothetical protein
VRRSAIAAEMGLRRRWLAARRAPSTAEEPRSICAKVQGLRAARSRQGRTSRPPTQAEKARLLLLLGHHVHHLASSRGALRKNSHRDFRSLRWKFGWPRLGRPGRMAARDVRCGRGSRFLVRRLGQTIASRVVWFRTAPRRPSSTWMSSSEARLTEGDSPCG